MTVFHPLFSKIPSQISCLITSSHTQLDASFGLVDFERTDDSVSPTGERRFVETAAWMEERFEKDQGMKIFMDFLCRNDFLRPIGRLAVYHLFLWDCTGSNGFVMRSAKWGSGKILTDCWVVENQAPSLKENLKLFRDLVVWLFWTGLFVTGWGKMVSGFQTLIAIKSLETKRDGQATANLEVQNVLTEVEWRNCGLGTAHMVAVCALATKLDLPVKLAIADSKNIEFYARFGFSDMGQIPGLPKNHPYYHWMVYEPRSAPMNEEQARELLRPAID